MSERDERGDEPSEDDSEIVERVAKAVFEARSSAMAAKYPPRLGYRGLRWDELPRESRFAERHYARIAIAALEDTPS